MVHDLVVIAVYFMWAGYLLLYLAALRYAALDLLKRANRRR